MDMGKRARARLDCSLKPPQPQPTHTYTHVCLCVAHIITLLFWREGHLDLGVWRSQLTTPAVRARAVFLWLLHEGMQSGRPHTQFEGDGTRA